MEDLQHYTSFRLGESAVIDRTYTFSEILAQV